MVLLSLAVFALLAWSRRCTSRILSGRDCRGVDTRGYYAARLCPRVLCRAPPFALIGLQSSGGCHGGGGNRVGINASSDACPQQFEQRPSSLRGLIAAAADDRHAQPQQQRETRGPAVGASPYGPTRFTKEIHAVCIESLDPFLPNVQLGLFIYAHRSGNRSTIATVTHLA